jgi:RNA recognition motif-containing protein
MKMKKVYVGNLPYRITKEELSDHFEDCGSIQDIILIKDRETGRSKGFGFVEFETSDQAQEATRLDGKECDGRPLKVSIAKERSN